MCRFNQEQKQRVAEGKKPFLVRDITDKKYASKYNWKDGGNGRGGGGKRGGGRGGGWARGGRSEGGGEASLGGDE